MNDGKVFAVVLSYDFFRNMSEERRLKMLANSDNVEWRVYIPREKQELLSDFEKERLEGFVITDVEPVKVRTYSKKDLFPQEIPVLIDGNKLKKNERKAERKRLKRNVPLKIGKVNTKKLGRR